MLDLMRRQRQLVRQLGIGLNTVMSRSTGRYDFLTSAQVLFLGSLRVFVSSWWTGRSF